ncbi:MAG: hypothetical protein ISN29_11890 [Gammaproteobacteria bacterium AqS3]|nr:hypothetical protein [Gammaproteobacteria bacterium AqS3]
MGSDFSNTDLSESIAKDFLKANKTEEVDAALQSHPDFDNPENWKPYGRAEKNWDRIGVQTSEPVGALAELIINSIDAILMRKAAENRVKPDSPDAPQNMAEAVNRFYKGVIEGKLSNLSPTQRTKIAEEAIVIGVKRPTKRSKYPNYTIVDYGEGQNHTNFENTFLSLGEKNKEGIPFVQGRFNMGSTGSIVFCTRSDITKGLYKFILSKRSLPDSDGLWGWTLIRVRGAYAGEVLPVAEYFCPDGIIPHFKADLIQPFSENADIGRMNQGGSVVKLYEYDIDDSRVFFGLYDGLTTSLIDCALPLRIYDFDAEPLEDKGPMRAEGISAITFSGMKVILGEKEKVEDDDDFSVSSMSEIIVSKENPDLGNIEIFYYGLEKMKHQLRTQPHRFFYTINGQTQAKERASFLRRASLDDLRNHLIVQINCNGMDPTARSSIFKPDRERMSNNRLSRELRTLIADKLKDDGRLRDFARKIKVARIEETINEEEKNVLEELAKNSPELKELFNMGGAFSDPTQASGREGEYQGRKFPTYLTPTGLDGNNAKELPMRNYRRIECKTDAENEYLSRVADPGTLLSPEASELPNSCYLRNGRLHIKIEPPKNANAGDEINVRFGFQDNNPDRAEPLMFDLKVIITGAEKPQTNPAGTRSGVGNQDDLSKDFPKIESVQKDSWDKYGFNDESGGYVASQDNKFTVYVNMDNKYLKRLVMLEKDENSRELIRSRYRLGVGILTLAMYKRMVYDEDQNQDSNVEWGEEALYVASGAVAAYIVTLIEKLGEGKSILREA